MNGGNFGVGIRNPKVRVLDGERRVKIENNIINNCNFTGILLLAGDYSAMISGNSLNSNATSRFSNVAKFEAQIYTDTLTAGRLIVGNKTSNTELADRQYMIYADNQAVNDEQFGNNLSRSTGSVNGSNIP